MTDLESDTADTLGHQNINLSARFIAMDLILHLRKNKFPPIIYTSQLHMLSAYCRPQHSDYVKNGFINPNPLS